MATTNSANSYTFTKIADSKDSFSSFGSSPAINNEGNVVFQAQQPDGLSGIFTGSGSQPTTIVSNSDRFSLFRPAPVINDAGVVAFQANLKTIGSGIYTWSNGETTTIAESPNPKSFSSVTINNQGDVAFSGILEQGRGIYLKRGQQTTPVALQGSVYSILDGYSLNDSGTVAYSASLNAGGRVINVSNNGQTTTIADTSDRYNFLFPPAINNTQTIAFKAFLKEGSEGIFTIKDGQTTTISDNNGVFSFFENPTINDKGVVAFKGVLKDGGLGIFTGTDPVANKVIAAGDTISDLKVTDVFLSNRGLNNANQIVFYAKLSDGSSGIYRAEPNARSLSSISMPDSISLLGSFMVGIFCLALLRWKQNI